MIINDIEPGMTNIVDNQTVRKILNDVLTDVEYAVGFTLGPAGKTALIHDPNGVTSLYPNKDGYNQIMNLHYNDYFYDSVLKIIRDAAMHCNITVGDATTSSVIILSAFYKKLREVIDTKKFSYISDSGIVTILEVMKNVLKKFLYDKNYIRKFNNSSEEWCMDHNQKMSVLTKVATVAANNDNEIGTYIAHLFDKVLDSEEELDVSITPNSHNETTEATEIGFYMPCGYINRVYATERDGRTAIYNDPRFLIIEGPLLDGDLPLLEPFISYVCIMNDRPLVIMAEDYSRNVMQRLYSLRIGGIAQDPETGKSVTLPPLSILPLQHSSADDLGREKTLDLETALGGHVLPLQSSTLDKSTIPTEPAQMELMLGSARKIVSINNECRIFDGGGNPQKIKGRVEEIARIRDEIVIKDSDYAQLTIAEYNARIAMLKSNMLSIKVGGSSFKERQYNVRVFEDAVYACKATIKHGYTLIGQTSLRALLTTWRTEVCGAIVKEILSTKNNVIFGPANKKETHLTEIVNTLIDVLYSTILKAYEIAIKNAIQNEKASQEIFDEIDKEIIEHKCAISYDVITDTYYTLTSPLNDNCPIYSAGSTDWEILNAIISVTAIFFNANTMMTLYIPKKEKT